MKEFLDDNNQTDKHPIGSYFKMCKELNETLKSMTCPSFNTSEVCIGFVVMITFISVVTIGVVLK